ncbi:nucleoside ABC transporter membrane protein [Carboxydocella thermautotrophica]|nr:nucleoside ABC transporter membrane protein [Carboxydocella thermautotrophica]
MKRFLEWLVPVGAILLAGLVGAVIMLAIGVDPLEAYGALIQGAFGDKHRFFNTLARSTPLIFTGLAVAFAFRTGLFNIGVEGQMYIAAAAAAYAGFAISLPGPIHAIVAILAAMAAAGIWAAIPGYLKAKLGVHEVINTIMMNYIAYGIAAYYVKIFQAPGQVPRTPDVAPSAALATIQELTNNWTRSKMNVGFFLALVALVVVWYLLWKTVTGYEIRAVGLNPLAAEYGGINVKKMIILAMTISGVLAGLAGAERVLGFHRAYISNFSPGYGFEGIAVALLGKNHPVGVLFSALLFGALANGGQYMNMATRVPADLIVVIQAIIIFFVAADQIVRSFLPKLKGGEA